MCAINSKATTHKKLQLISRQTSSFLKKNKQLNPRKDRKETKRHKEQVRQIKNKKQDTLPYQSSNLQNSYKDSPENPIILFTQIRQLLMLFRIFHAPYTHFSEPSERVLQTSCPFTPTHLCACFLRTGILSCITTAKLSKSENLTMQYSSKNSAFHNLISCPSGVL